MTVDSRHSTDFTPSFEAEDDEVVQYRSVSGLSIAALFIGLAAPLCLLAPLLMVIPIVGAVVALIAMRQIAASDGALIGRRAAAFGLALCVASGVATVSRAKVTQYLRTQQAEAVARQWITLLQKGQTEPAFRLTVRGATPKPPDPPGLPPAEPEEDPLALFLRDPIVEAVQAARERAAVRLVDNLDYSAQPRGQYFVRQRFSIAPPAGDTSLEPFELTITSQRARFSGARQLRWLVASFESDDVPAGDHDAHPH